MGQPIPGGSWGPPPGADGVTSVPVWPEHAHDGETGERRPPSQVGPRQFSPHHSTFPARSPPDLPSHRGRTAWPAAPTCSLQSGPSSDTRKDCQGLAAGAGPLGLVRCHPPPGGSTLRLPLGAVDRFGFTAFPRLSRSAPAPRVTRRPAAASGSAQGGEGKGLQVPARPATAGGGWSPCGGLTSPIVQRARGLAYGILGVVVFRRSAC